MIIYTEPTEEAKEYGMIIPLSAVIEDGEICIHAYEQARDVAIWLDGLKISAFAKEILSELDRRLRPIAYEMGYLPEDGYVFQTGKIFKAMDILQIDASLIRKDTVRYERKEEHQYLTETVLDEASDACTIYATVCDNEVRSFANLNHDDGDVCDIGVESAEGFAGQGLASSNVAALTLALLKKGREVLYVALSDNPASIRVAEKVGFSRVGEEYNYVCFFREEGEYGV